MLQQEPFFDDFWFNAQTSADTSPPKSLSSCADSSEAFCDPLSDLNLFLSKKIQSEITKEGSAKEWSIKIQDNLLSSILPEFKQKFPGYRLGVSALRKAWEKVSFYYEKIHKHSESLNGNGKLDINYMIKENIRQIPAPAGRALHPYNYAHKIAVKISECIGTIEGKRPNLDLLIKAIWSSQKHILPNLTPSQARSPYDVYDAVDHLIVKQQLSLTASDPSLSAKELSSRIKNSINTYKELVPLATAHRLTSLSSALLSYTLYPSTMCAKLFRKKEQEAILSFIRREVVSTEQSSDISLDTHCLELTKRILALFPIMQALPQDIDTDQFKRAIEYVHRLDSNAPLTYCPIVPQTLYLFINSQMHILRGRKEFNSLKKVQNTILEAYQLALQVPHLALNQLDQIEMLIWQTIDRHFNLLKNEKSELISKLDEHLVNSLIDHPNLAFHKLISHTTRFFRSLVKLDLSEQNLCAKIYIWTIQNDMLCRWMHCNEESKLFKLVEKQKNAQNSHKDVIDSVVAEYISLYPLLSSYRTFIKIKATIFHKYLWYNRATGPSETSLERFLKYQENTDNLGPRLPLTPLETA